MRRWRNRAPPVMSRQMGSCVSSLNRAIRALERAESKIAELEQRCSEPIAIIGIGCRFPNGKNPERFWESLEAGVDSVTELAAKRWPLEAQGRAERPLYAALLDEEDVYGFDAGFFGVSAREAAAIDPQQRLFLQVAVEALEDAGIPLERARGAKAGAFVGMMTLDYQCLSMSRSIAALDIHTATGIGPCFASGRVSHLLGFEGPSVSIDTACSSSLVTLHLACQSLRAGECDVAVAGGVNLILSPHTMQLYTALQALSPDGHCYTFDERANGFVRGEGCGVVVCKRLSDALRQGDDIRAVIRGTAVNHNGRSSGLVAPSVMAQRALLAQALAAAQLGGDALDYIEVHGIGTALGDAIELEALKAVMGGGRDGGAACKLGSLKPNVGHLEAASGIAGVIKAILALEHERIPRQIHFAQQSSRISLRGTSLEICAEGAEWRRGARVRRAGVSALGLSGTNAHVVLEEAPRRDAESVTGDVESATVDLRSDSATRERDAESTASVPAVLPVVVLAARSEGSLRAQAARYLELVARRDARDVSAGWLRDLAYTTTQRRSHHAHRLAVIARSESELAAQLRGWLDGGMPEGVRAGRAAAGGARVVLAFGTGERWRCRRPAALDALIARVRPMVAGHAAEERELEVLARGATGSTEAKAGATELGELGRLVWMLALAEELVAAGVEAEVALGEGVGALAAACAAGALAFEEAVVAVRSGAPREAVRWGEVLAAAVGEDEAVVVTVGGGAEMQSALCALRGPRLHVAPWLDRGAVTAEALAQVQAAMFAAGGEVRWSCGETARLLRLPGYAWQLDAHRIELPPTGGVVAAAVEEARVEKSAAREMAEVRDLSSVVRRERSPLLVQRWAPRSSSSPSERAGAGAPVVAELSGRWLVVTDAASAGRGGQLAALIGAAGGAAKVVHVEDHLEDEEGGAAGAQAAVLEDSLEAALDESFGEADGRGVIFFEAAGALAEGGEPHLAVERAVWRLSRLVGALAARTWRRAAPRLWLIIEEDAGSTGPGDAGDAGAAAAMAGAALWAAGRTIGLEHPSLGCARVGLARGAVLEALLDVLGEDGARALFDEELALRGGQWQVGRLERLPVAALSAELDESHEVDREVEREVGREVGREVVRAGERALRLELDRPGILEEMRYRAMALPALGPREVRVKVRAAGLNFMDVMTAMGLYPGANRGERGAIVLGGECAGTIDAIGDAVSGLAVGDEVVAVGRGAFGSHLVTDEAYVQRRPDGLDEVLAAGAPIVFLTAWYALITLGQLAPGERVLVHSAASGVGMAALQICRWRGAEVWATAGTEEKRAWLRAQGVACVMDSRSTRFADEVLASTGGEGVDVVLNALSGEAIEASLRALASDGRFFEIGKTDIYAEARALSLSPFRRRLSYHAVDLLGLAEERPRRFAALFAEVMAAFSSGVLSPLPTKVRPAAEVVEAFVEMASGRHQGKLVVRIADEAVDLEAVPVDDGEAGDSGEARVSRPRCEPEASYLITGGMGGGRRLGSLVDWLVSQGARKVVWLDRLGLGRGVEAQALALEALGVELVVCEGDVAELDCVRDAVAAAESLGPLRGVIHAAAAGGADREGLAGWIRAKAAGAWNLHVATEGLALSWFALFSSAGAQLGAPGRAQMAAADGALDGLARHRRARGLAALSVQWGEIAEERAEGGADDRVSAGDRALSLGAVSHLAPERAWRWFGQALGSSRAELCVIELRTRQLIELFPQLAASSRFAALLAEGDAGQPAGERELLEEIWRASERSRRRVVERAVQKTVARVVRAAAEQIDVEAPFKSLGVDSLGALELRNRLEASFGVSLSAALIWAYPDVRSLSGHLLERLVAERARGAAGVVGAEETASRLEVAAREAGVNAGAVIAAGPLLSEERKAALLVEELESLERLLQ